jgi:NAD(P)-dependent dehydrogenase (short-subunit alcohol dehydrogenase family)
LINNAGTLVYKNIGELSADELDLMYRINLKAPFLLIQALLPLMSKGSHIVNIGSMGGIQGSVKFPGLSGYSATKGALSILTEALAEELKDSGISINCLAPGSVQTEMLAQAFPGFKASLEPREMAQFIRDFALHSGKFFNGKVLPVSTSTP